MSRKIDRSLLSCCPMQDRPSSNRLAVFLREAYLTVSTPLGLWRIHGKEKALVLAMGFRLLDLWLPAAVYILERFTSYRVAIAEWHTLSLIGHLALDYDCYFKERHMAGAREKTVFIMLSNDRVNQTLLDFWREKAIFVRCPSMAFEPYFRSHPTLAHPLASYASVLEGPSRAHYVQREWVRTQSAPLIKISASDELKGRQALRDMGLKDDDWFVCFHCRESGFAPDRKSESYRDCEIDTFYDGMRLITDAGGFVIRMGDASMKAVAIEDENVIDYARSKWKSDFLDIYLSATCRFFVGTSSGLYCVAGIFGRPTIQVNVTPLSCLYSQFPADVSIPKLVSDSAGRVLTFGEWLTSPVSSFRTSHAFEEAGYRNINNSSDDILDVVEAMLARVESGLSQPTREQAALKGAFAAEHYSAGSGAEVCAAFLRKHPALMADILN